MGRPYAVGSLPAGGKAVLENYIVRIYRRDPSDPDGIIGFAGEIGSDRSIRFRSFEELRRILCVGKFPPPGKKSKEFRNKGRRSGPARPIA